MNQATHLISLVSSRAKKEIRNKGGIRSHEKIYLNTSGTDASFALRIFVSELFSGRRDISFVRKETDASLILGDKTLDGTAEQLLTSVLNGTAASYLTSPKIRTIHPFSGIPAEEISEYAKLFGWKKETPQVFGRVHEFLDEFSRLRPSAKYALKNVSDKLHEKADILSSQIDNHERGEQI
ncbi:MAG TPA: hypothetical protein O0X42_01320 [Methanocorpusculum sp.]|nr:hypothetical protein [Methanocorpusculum sp.]